MTESKDFADWWSADGRYLDPDTSDVPWFDKREALAKYAFEAGKNAALSASSPPVGGSGEVVVVKPLEWGEPYRHGEYVSVDARSVVGSYSIFQLRPGAYYNVCFGVSFVADKDGLPDAKSAAQADYEARIRSALAAPVPNGVLEGWCDMSTAPTDGTHILVRFDGTSSPPTVAHWFGPPPLPGLRAGGWYLSVQQFEGPQIHPTRWMPVPEDRVAASPVTPEGK